MNKIDFLNIGSDFGLLHYNKYNLTYLPILKNAHTWCENLLTANFGVSENEYHRTSEFSVVENYKFYEKLKKNICVIILRDPIERYIAGITQELLSLNMVDYKDIQVQQFITRGLLHGNHTTYQSVKINNINLSQCVFFMCNNDLEINVMTFLENWFDIKIQPVMPHNRWEDNPLKTELYPGIKNIVETSEECMSTLKRHYVMDYSVLTYIKTKNLFFTHQNKVEYITRLENRFPFKYEPTS